MSDRRFALVDFTYRGKKGRVRLHEAGTPMPYHEPWPTPRQSARLSRSNGHSIGSPPSIFRSPEALSEAEVIEAEAELKALQRHALELVDPEAKVDTKRKKKKKKKTVTFRRLRCSQDHPNQGQFRMTQASPRHRHDP